MNSQEFRRLIGRQFTCRCVPIQLVPISRSQVRPFGYTEVVRRKVYQWGQTCIKPSVGNLWPSSATDSKTSAPRNHNRKEIHKELGQLVENRKVTSRQPAARYCQGLCSTGCRLQNPIPRNPKILIQDVDRQNTQNVGCGHPHPGLKFWDFSEWAASRFLT